MSIRHYPVVVADARVATILYRTTVDGATFADRVPITDGKRRRLPRIFLVLRIIADRCELKNVIVFTDYRGTLDDGVRFDPSSRPNLNIGADNSVRAYRSLAVNPSVTRYDRSLMNHSVFPGAWSISVDATRSPFILAVALNRQKFRRLATRSTVSRI